MIGGVRESLIKFVVEMRCEFINGIWKCEFVIWVMSFKLGMVYNLFFFVDVLEGRFVMCDFLVEMVLEDVMIFVFLYDIYFYYWLMYEYVVLKNDSDVYKYDLMEEF